MCLHVSDSNLYIGTSASEILHLVSLPPDPDADDSSSTYILASRLQPSGHAQEKDSLGRRGVQQILVLPGPSKAVVLCNGTVSFYSLPELSPAFPNREPTGVQWIGGLDENADRNDPDGAMVMIANGKRILQVKVGEKLRPAKSNIEYPGCLGSSRRGTIACVADKDSYALLEVEHQQKIPLFSISTAITDEPVDPTPRGLSTSPSRPPNEGASPPGHGRSSSLGNLMGSIADRTRSPQPSPLRNDSLRPPAAPISTRDQSAERPSTRQRSSTEGGSPVHSETVIRLQDSNLSPHILSPVPSEFMLTTGTSSSEPGVGMFVNLDGDVVRGTVEFPSYPEAIIVDSFATGGPERSGPDESSQMIVALIARSTDGKNSFALQIQPLPDTSSELKVPVVLPLPQVEHGEYSSIAKVLDFQQCTFDGVPDLLQAIPVRASRPGALIAFDHPDDDPRTSSAVEQLEQEKALFDNGSGQQSSDDLEIGSLTKRLADEQRFVARLGQQASRQMVWSGGKLWHLMSNPLILQLESTLQAVQSRQSVNVSKARPLLDLMATIRTREPSNEVDFLSLGYIRQKISLVLLLHLQTLLHSESALAENQSAVENALHESALDPRIILLLTPPLAAEVSQGPQGIWLHQGIVDAASGFQSKINEFADAPIEFWMMIRHFLTLWQEKRGYGSITDEKQVFDSVDAALLHVLLYLDQALPRGSGLQASARAKLNNVVDHWKGNFDRAASLLERFNRLYVLSRLYQSRKQARDVLGTWKRILDGERDFEHRPNSAELEGQIRRYLTVIRDVNLVQDYGIYLAQRNPSLGVQIFADDASRVKFNPPDVIRLLKEHAPGAVQQYLEHLVFNKNLDKYSDDLIGYYLDSVLNVLESSEGARNSLAQTYSTYRALTSPKPTYLNFITENAPSDPWWQSRLRLLQLLGNGGYATSSSTNKELTYSVPMVLDRLAPFSSYLVSESIILDARQGRHKEALRLLTHGLGDYDTAVRYCYFGGPTPSSSRTIDASELPARGLQQELFEHLFHEFLVIEGVEERLERTSQLLGKFATWFDPLKILMEVPDDWSVAMLSEFLLRSFRAATSKRNEAVIVKALSAAQNLQIQVEFVEACEKVGATIEAEKGMGGDGDVGEVAGDIEVS
jgi:vacuolar protein sorting-associated protein 3